jgi:membrane fusion protein, multidrug efflux system
MNRTSKLGCDGSLAILIAAMVVLTCLGACQNRIDKDDEEKKPASGTSPTTPPPAKISFENGQAILTLDQQTQNRMGIELATLSAAVTRPQVAVPAMVLSVQELATFRNGYIATQSQIEKDRVDTDVARKEYSRLKMLFDNNKNISEKALQSAEGSLHSLEVDERTAEQQLNLQASVTEQQWGNVVAKWAMDGSPELERILAMRDALVQVTLPFEQHYNAPRKIAVEIPGRTRTEATLISAFPRVDPRIQGRSFLYVSSGQPDFTPGINLLAHFAFGNSMRGVIMPASSVIWSEGKAWTYLQTAPNQFSRREIATDVPVDNGYLVTAGFSAGSKVVRSGAQSLFSEESVLQGYGGGASDEN